VALGEVEVRCPFCGHTFPVEVHGSRKKRLLEIVDFIAEQRPTVEEAISWIMRQYGVRRVKAIEYIHDLAKIGYIRAEGIKLVRTMKPIII